MHRERLDFEKYLLLGPISFIEWGNGEKPVDQKYRLPSDRKLLQEGLCWMTSLALFYKVRPIAQRGLYLLGLFCRFILKVDGFQHPQAAFYIVSRQSLGQRYNKKEMTLDSKMVSMRHFIGFHLYV